MTKDESYRLLSEWWGECHTCKHWMADRGAKGLVDGMCWVPRLSGMETTTSCGHCRWWDAFDVDVAIQIMEEDEEKQ